ncbi:N-succinylarginine dihydrolase [Pseudoalteromonas sp. APC 3224]|uniref:N-succinylarginine dihydrolase n=1 Tax=Pseudoalteromonas sp. APC 3224 TaxID=3035203 RepID=UPI0025B2D48B|nr:N-succinylarginine dihydrolase [Pseudoalteromonas sp. APC 3224]MDN3485523.1 N-succinylarginine dihydrolase [Pseudoalteromonas sp. APC 3224]
MHALEVNFDGLVGPTHNYAGLSYGNVASLNNAASFSNPQEAVLQGLAKMKAMHDKGLTQGVFAPHARPDLNVLRRLGFTGNEAQVINKAFKADPILLRACYSASAMWTANAATVSPSPDTNDGKVHFTAANLNNKFHRSLEPNTTTRLLKAMFSNEQYFAHHTHLPEQGFFGDEGAANHTRLCDSHGETGLELFVFGASAFNSQLVKPAKFPARQTLEASEAICRLHNIKDTSQILLQQNPDVIDQGVFHNDVIAVGNANVLLCHQQAFLNQTQALDDIREAYVGNKQLHIIEVPTSKVSIQDAVSSYLFNSQLVSMNDDAMLLVAPQECQRNPAVKAYIEELIVADNPINQVQFFDLRQSMQNGGGPACLRLRVALNSHELAAVNPDVILNDEKYTQLCDWATRHYRDKLGANDFADPALLTESYQALDELTQLLSLGSVYPFQLEA